MKLYYTLYEDGDGWNQIYEISANIDNLVKFSRNSYGHVKYPLKIYVYDTDSSEPLSPDIENPVLFMTPHEPYTQVSNKINNKVIDLLWLTDVRIDFNDTHTKILLNRKVDQEDKEMKAIQLLAPNAKFISDTELECSEKECWYLYKYFPTNRKW